MADSVDWLLHPRIVKHCMPLYLDGHHPDAAAKAMTQVEQAIKEKSGATRKFGVSLTGHVFGEGAGTKLRVPFGEHMQKDADSYFRGTFAYYRNYAHHEGEHIDQLVCLRVMIIASDLLDLVGASTRSFAEVGGVEGLMSEGIFPSRRSVYKILEFLQGHTLPYETCDGFYEDLYGKGFTKAQLQAVLDLGLAEYHTDPLVDSGEWGDNIGVFDLTPLGEATQKELVGSP